MAMVLRLLVLSSVVTLSACTTVLLRDALPAEKAEDITQVAPYGIKGADLRFWGDTLTDSEVDTIINQRLELRADIEAASPARRRSRDTAWLALSGGGPDGAFGAGILAGWAESGERPEFEIVTGVSTGAIIALFAFLGPEYDPVLKQIYTSYSTRDLTTRAVLAGLLRGTALLDTSGFRALIDSYLDDEVMRRLAEAHDEGRVLLIGTTNLDAGRPMIWNITAIAATGAPMAKRLIGDVIQGSSAIPAAFPPSIIPVEVDGRSYDEMHVDGGATQQVMLFSPQLPVGKLDRKIGVNADRTVYIIINNKLRRRYQAVRPRMFSIASTAISSLISGSGTGDVFRIFAVAERDGIALRLISIPPEFDKESNELFDPEYMRALDEFGFEMGLEGVEWLPHPPDFLPAGAR